MDCQQIELIHAYHDGELPPAQVAAVEAHLNDCADCRALLADLRHVSQLVAAAPLVDVPPQAMTRMQQAWWAAGAARAAQDRGVLRIASWLTAAAAAVIFAAVMFSPSPNRDGSTNTGANFSLAALTPPAEMQDQDEPQQDEVIDAAQWIANDISLAMR
jgi:anti-sigma factor RsiW